MSRPRVSWPNGCDPIANPASLQGMVNVGAPPGFTSTGVSTGFHCHQPPTYELLYKSSNPLRPGLRPYNRKNPPRDVATTTTDQGVRVPFIVRQEKGFQNRDRYTILTLWQPGRKWKPWAPQKQWNRKLLVTHGGGCGASYGPGDPPLGDYAGTFEDIPITEDSYVTALGRGFAVMSAALANTGHNCNAVLNAEAVMMAKERVVERYG